MQEILPTLFAVALVILTLVLTAVGIQLILVLNSFRQALNKINNTFDELEEKIQQLTQPLQSLAGIAAGVKTGVKVFEGFVNFLNRKKDEEANPKE